MSVGPLWKGLTAVVGVSMVTTILINAQLRADYAAKIAPYWVDDELRNHIAQRAATVIQPKLRDVRRDESSGCAGITIPSSWSTRLTTYSRLL